MKRIRISADLEREIRAYPRNAPVSATEIMDKIIAVLDAEEPKKTPGISYTEIVRVMREEIGDRLAVPPNPHVTWIVRQVNRVKELGLNVEQIRVITRQAGVSYRGRVELEFILRMATRLLSAGNGISESSGENAGTRVITGRQDDE